MFSPFQTLIRFPLSKSQNSLRRSFHPRRRRRRRRRRRSKNLPFPYNKNLNSHCFLFKIMSSKDAMYKAMCAKPMSYKHLIIALDSTAQMGLYWPIILSDYLEKIIRHFCGHDSTGQESSGGQFRLSLVRYKSYEPRRDCYLHPRRTAASMDEFLKWLSAISFSGDGFDDLAIAQGLGIVLTMDSWHLHGLQAKRRTLGRQHCILVAASNPFPEPISVPIHKVGLREYLVADSEKVAKRFTPYNVSLSVISPKQLPILREIYNSGNSNLQGEDSFVDDKNPEFLILISKNFPEAHAALSEYNVASTSSNQNSVEMEKENQLASTDFDDTIEQN